MGRDRPQDLSAVTIRRLGPEDDEFLRAMFLYTFAWREEGPPLSIEEAFVQRDLATYIAGWGRAGDAGVLAVTASERVGAAWYRVFSKADHGYGFVSEEIPELGIAVVPAQRGRGIGPLLLRALAHVAIDDRHPGLSLSVEEDNSRALRIYERAGFRRVGRVGNASTMLLMFRRAAAARTPASG